MVSVTIMSSTPLQVMGSEPHNNHSTSDSGSSGRSASSKAILQSALKQAQKAVEYDHSNDFINALKCYQEALDLITTVLDTSPNFRSNPRLNSIQTSYIERVSLLTTLVESQDSTFLARDFLSEKDSGSSISHHRYSQDGMFLEVKRDSDTVSFISDHGHQPVNLASELKMAQYRPTSCSSSIYTPSVSTGISSPIESSFHISEKRLSSRPFPTPMNSLNDAILPNGIHNFNDRINKRRVEDKVALAANPRYSLPPNANQESPPIVNSVIEIISASEKNDRHKSMPVPPMINSDPGSFPSTPSLKSLSVIYEAEFPDGIASSLNFNRNELSSPLLSRPSSEYRQNRYSTLSEDELHDLPTDLMMQRCNTDSSGSRYSQNTSSTRRISSLPSTPRPSSFLLASSKVVDLAVNSQPQASHKSSRQYNLVTIQRVFREEPPEGCTFEPSPNSNELRVFWLMRNLERSMTVGGYLSSKLYIPRSVWHQVGVKIQFLEVKVQSCELVSDYLGRFRAIDVNDTPKILKELEGLDTLLNSVQSALAKKINYIEPLKRPQSSAFASLSNRISKSVEKIQLSYLKLKSDSSTHYVDSLIKLFKAAQFLEKWYQYFVSLPSAHPSALQIVARLNRVNAFLSSGVCAFVVRDMAIMLAKYLKRLRASITE